MQPARPTATTQSSGLEKSPTSVEFDERLVGDFVAFLTRRRVSVDTRRLNQAADLGRLPNAAAGDDRPERIIDALLAETWSSGGRRTTFRAAMRRLAKLAVLVRVAGDANELVRSTEPPVRC